MKFKYVIIGAGPAGLSFALNLLKHNEHSFILLESENEAGGLCRSQWVDGFPLDIGGCHLLDSKNKIITELIFSFLPEDEWSLFERDNRICLGKYEMGFPFEANIWQLPEELQNKYISSIKNCAALRGEPLPKTFLEWVRWKFGDDMAEDYLIPYNDKIWSYDLSLVGTYWLHKLPPITHEDIAESCLKKTSCQKYPAHKTFYYPKKDGFGEAFLRMAELLDGHIVYNYKATDIDWDTKTVNGEYTGETIINTAPWQSLKQSFPENMQIKIDNLHYASLDIDYYPEKPKTTSQATYYPDLNLPYHRKIFRFNYNPESKGYWTETNSKRRKVRSKEHFTNEFAYPISTLDKPKIMHKLLQWTAEYNVYGLGRWGEFEHMNTDVAMQRAIDLSDALIKYNKMVV